jgi:predicted secreted hydrolase
MNVRALLLLSLLVLLSACDDAAPPAKGFAGLAQPSQDYAQVSRGRTFEFPRDHGAHPGYRIEWWYVTANLRDAQGEQFGVQWTLFRNALRANDGGTGWADGNLWLGHIGLTSATRQFSAQALGRGGVGQAGVTLEPFAAWIDNNSLTSLTAPGSPNPLAQMRLHGAGEGFSYTLDLHSAHPPVLQGDAGYSQKSAKGQASYYYSQPFFQASGELLIDGKRYSVSGPAWLDREWSSQPLAADQPGWDWLALHLADGAQLMLYRLRQNDGQHYLTANWIDADGSNHLLPAEALQLAPQAQTDVNGHKVPTTWRLQVPSRQLDIVIAALNPKAWMAVSTGYWEGPVHFSGSQEGVGYLEMTGY